MKKLLHHFPHYAMKTNHSLLNYMSRNAVLFGNHILLPLDITAAKPYLLLILSWGLQSLSSRFDNTLNDLIILLTLLNSLLKMTIS